VKLVDDFALGYTDCRNEETRFFLYDNVDELGQLAARVIKLAKHIIINRRAPTGRMETTYVCLARATTDLRKEQVDTEWRVGILQILL